MDASINSVFSCQWPRKNRQVQQNKENIDSKHTLALDNMVHTYTLDVV